MKSSRLGLFLTSFSLICSGLCCIVDEYILAQLSSNILGNPAQQWPIVIGLMLLATGVGAWIAQFVKEHNTLRAFIIIELTLSFLGGFSPLLIMISYSYAFLHFKLIFYGVSFLIGLLIGFEQPLIATINKKFVGFRSNISMTISLDVLGAAIGTFIWIKFLVGKVEIYHAAFMVTLLNLSVALLTYLFLSRNSEEKETGGKWMGLLIVLVSVLGLTGMYFSGSIADVAEQQLYTGQIIHKESTPYQRVVLTKNAKNDDVLLFLNGALQFSSRDEYRYHENLVHPAMTMRLMKGGMDAKLNVLVLGGGDGMAVREIKKYQQVEHITLVDLDPAVVDIAKTNEDFIALNDSSLWDSTVDFYPLKQKSTKKKEAVKMFMDEKDDQGNNLLYTIDSVEVLHADAYKFVEDMVKDTVRYDLIFIDFPDPRNESLGKLYSKYFFSRTEMLLKENGFMAIQSSSPVHAHKSYVCVGKTLTAAGYNVAPYHDNVPSFREWGWYLASKSSDRLNMTRLNERMYTMDDFFVETRYLTPKKHFANTIFGKDVLENTDDIMVSTLTNPVVYHYYVEYAWKNN